MITEEEILDIDILDSNSPVLNSKLSIVLATIILSPLSGAILYGINLYKTNQQNKIFGTSTALIVCNLMVFLPLLGFAIYIKNFGLEIYIARAVSSLLLIFPIWKSHFKNNQHRRQFNFKIFGLLIFFEFIFLQGFWLLMAKIFSFPSGFFVQPFLLLAILLTKVVIDLIKGKPFKTRN